MTPSSPFRVSEACVPSLRPAHVEPEEEWIEHPAWSPRQLFSPVAWIEAGCPYQREPELNVVEPRQGGEHPAFGAVREPVLDGGARLVQVTV